MNHDHSVIELREEHIHQCFNLDKISLEGFWSKNQWREELTNERNLTIGIVINNKLIAFASGSIISDQLEINLIAVHPQNRKKGFGKKILCSLMERAKCLNVKKVTLEVESENIPAKNLYTMLKFKQVGTRKKYYRDGNDALIYSKSLIS